jgi:hypothetical protein
VRTVTTMLGADQWHVDVPRMSVDLELDFVVRTRLPECKVTVLQQGRDDVLHLACSS